MYDNEMDKAIRVMVLDWIIAQLRIGKTRFDIDECTEAIGLDPSNPVDQEMVNEVFQWNQEQLNAYFLDSIDENT